MNWPGSEPPFSLDDEVALIDHWLNFAIDEVTALVPPTTQNSDLRQEGNNLYCSKGNATEFGFIGTKQKFYCLWCWLHIISDKNALH